MLYVCLCVTYHYLHLDLHAAVRELLNHTLDPYERLHLSDREGGSGGREAQGQRGENRAEVHQHNTHHQGDTGVYD